MPIREGQIEDYLCRRVKKLGGIAYKFTSPGRRSVPDRMCLLPRGRVVFVEVKAPGKKPTEKQAREIQKLRDMGHKVEVLDSHDAVDDFINSTCYYLGIAPA